MDVKLALAQDSLPLSIICAAKIVGVSLTIDPSLASGAVLTLHLSSG
jgi:glutamyl-tRNA synthetase